MIFQWWSECNLFLFCYAATDISVLTKQKTDISVDLNCGIVRVGVGGEEVKKNEYRCIYFRF